MQLQNAAFSSLYSKTNTSTIKKKKIVGLMCLPQRNPISFLFVAIDINLEIIPLLNKLQEYFKNKNSQMLIKYIGLIFIELKVDISVMINTICYPPSFFD